MNVFKQLIVLVFFSMLVSCASAPLAFIELQPENKTDAVIYIYRPASMSNVLVEPEVLVNNEKIAEIKNDTYLTKSMPAGEYTVKLKLAERYAGKQTIDFKVEAAESIFLRINTTLKFEMNKPYSRSFSIERVDKERALAEIKLTQNAANKKNSKQNRKDEEENSVNKNEEEGVRKDQFSIQKTRNPFAK